MIERTEAWINIYKHKNSYWCGNPNHTKLEALLHLADTENYLTTVNIEQLLKLQEENTELKDLLKECHDILYEVSFKLKNVNDIDKCCEARKKIREVLGEEYGFQKVTYYIRNRAKDLGEE